MAWENEYSHKLTTAAEALQVVESGMRVFVHASSGFPTALVNALADRAPSLRDVEIVHLLIFSEEPTAEVQQYAKSFRHTCFFIGGDMRRAVAEGRADYVPIHLGETERLTTREGFSDRRCADSGHASGPIRIGERRGCGRDNAGHSPARPSA